MATAQFLGMAGTMTGQTCGDACWQAREDVCRCQCSGQHHGVLRTANGIAPARTRTIKGRRYYFIAAIGAPGISEHEAYELDNTAYRRALAEYPETWWQMDYKGARSLAAPYTIRAWPELAAWRDRERPEILWWPESGLQWLPENIRPSR